MTSIRLKLVSLVLVLLAIAIAALGWLYFMTTRNALLAKDGEIRKFLHLAYEAQQKLEKEYFDEQLLRHASRLARLTQAGGISHFDQRVIAQLVCSSSSPTAPLSSTAVFDVNIALRLFGNSLNFSYTEPGDYFQLSRPWRSVIEGVRHSDNLRDNELPLPQLTGEEAIANVTTPRFEEFTLLNQKKVRCVSFRTDIPIYWNNNEQGSASAQTLLSRRGRFPFRPPPNVVNTPQLVPRGLYVQLAREVDELDKKLAELKEELQHEEQQAKADSDEALSSLNWRIFYLSIGTLVVTALGGIWLCRHSLKPLTDVAEAVSQISPKDFRLIHEGKELDEHQLPEELAPIVNRLKSSMASLEQAFSREKRATADISHELRTPIASLLTMAQVTLRKKRNEAEYREALEQCVETAQHLNGLVERLLRLSRLDAGVDKLQKEEVDVPDLAEQCVSMLKPMADEKGISLRFEKLSDQELGPCVNTDASKLREILLNLIDNAIQYNKPEGSVTVTVGSQNHEVEIIVADTGIGMSRETQQNLFKRFFRADEARHSEKVNAGLGLAIVKGYIDLMGARIDVKSELGKGTKFHIRLPEVKPITTAELVAMK